MSSTVSTEYRGHQPRNMAALREWQKAVPQEKALEPDLPILDTHHHIWGKVGDDHFYTIEDFQRDLDAGHNVIGSVYIEARRHGFRTDGPEEMKPVGEIERVISLIESHPHSCDIAAAIVAAADLSLGDKVVPVLEAEIAAAKGRMRGVRQSLMVLRGEAFANSPIRPREHILMEPGFRRGMTHLGRLGLCFDLAIVYDQIPEAIEVVDLFPNIPFILNHVGHCLGAATYRPRREEIRVEWKKNMAELARRQNVSVKLGGMGMPMFGFAFENNDARPASSKELQAAWQPIIETCISLFGTKRCMFESNFPPDMQSGNWNETWNAFKLATKSYSRDERADMFYRTGATVYRLPQIVEKGDAQMPK